jgi:hypothetical protein
MNAGLKPWQLSEVERLNCDGWDRNVIEKPMEKQ